MNTEVFLQFVDQRVTIVFENHFRLTGYIRRVYDDSFIFETYQKTGAISTDRIREIYPYNGSDHK